MNELSANLQPVTHFLKKHHAVLFISLICLMLAAAIYMLYDVMLKAEAPTESQTTSTISQFDQETIDKIKTLHDSNDTAESLTFPTTRFNPFTE